MLLLSDIIITYCQGKSKNSANVEKVRMETVLETQTNTQRKSNHKSEQIDM